ncbi:manganese/iron ABC transporter ATP-binding protein [Erwinia psidii]|uniref:Manganese/iron ABC transporter ATP-binding protein n=1 Tax=Erwinia psidii TaxID=69224 RepID=A0A3N6TQW1_9GAMM|nr:manganese/iron ABC transporter ATP-binding protein [Erwinia psidii]MCX8955798.1 manganese/iron ABC transporter ATP-binding protein [Erwinia psidii]MCX8961645.1 manganese/iron ABC transporter ATP-binding protein [Erwinia psidii]MCX8965745.1 manganese/iron ABC transporter ATP-binding protein [Erwinia psidii]RQM37632.1 manganese/iron ABC transporter ATP-binding protein [Erwinia psidii]
MKRALSDSPGISARGVTVTYRNGHTALRDASLSIPTGTLAALLGINGSGKSTLFKAIMGFVPLTEGDISLMGVPTRTALRQNQVAYVPQSEDVDWHFPVLAEDVVMMGRYGHMGMLRIPRKADHDAVAAALDRVGMSDFRHRQIGELSGGQKKRIFLARAIAQGGKIVLLDEPFTGIDLNTERQLISLLQQMRDEGCTLLVSTHNLSTVNSFCDYTVLVKGTVLACGPTADIFTASNLSRAFDGILHPLMSNDVVHRGEDPLPLKEKR